MEVGERVEGASRGKHQGVGNMLVGGEPHRKTAANGRTVKEDSSMERR